jgi:peptidoglycan/xylan/chitin deacetylase (PgdA/CDA1 family)/GT2 family glycosyltransferase
VYCSIIIPTVSRAALLSDTLDSLALQTVHDFETIVVCDGEDDHTRALSTRYIAAYPITWLFNSRTPLGPASARNIGAERAQGEVLVFLDDDGSPVAEWLLHHCKYHLPRRRNREVMIAGRLHETYMHPASSTTERLLREARARSEADTHARYILMGRDLSRLPFCGMNSSIRRDTFWAAGGFDAALRFAEDCELGTRLVERGVRLIYEPQAIVLHRNQKNLTDYQARVAALSGQSDVYRARQKGQRITQTQRLLRVPEAKGIRQLKERLGWQFPATGRKIGEVCRRLTELTGSHLTFRLWNSLISTAAYWDGVKSEGIAAGIIGWRQLKGEFFKRLPVLMYHHVGPAQPNSDPSLSVPAHRFEAQIRFLARRGYVGICPSDWLSWVRHGKPLPQKPMLLTFDDALADLNDHALPVLERYGFGAVVFVVTNCVGKTNVWDQPLGYAERSCLTAEQIQRWSSRGIEFGAHSRNHPDLTTLDEPKLRDEAAGSRADLEKITGSPVISFAYPYGASNAAVAHCVREHFDLAFTTDDGLNTLGTDPCLLHRNTVFSFDTPLDLEFLVRLGWNPIRRLRSQLRIRSRLLKGLRHMTLLPNEIGNAFSVTRH